METDRKELKKVGLCYECGKKKTEKIKRVELVNYTGEEVTLVKGTNTWVNHKYEVEASLQDNGETLKIFVYTYDPSTAQE